jgi:hypothetical protein
MRLRPNTQAILGVEILRDLLLRHYSEFTSTSLRTLIMEVIVFRLRVVTGIPMRFSTWLR